MSAALPDRPGSPPRGPAAVFWEAHYASKPPGTQGPNPILVEVASSLTPGSALDLGCGGGGDAIWLAQHGWHVTAVDISSTAVARAEDRVIAARLADKVRLECLDLAVETPAGAFDLVNAHYLLSPVDFDRSAVLRRLAAQINVGGTLLLVDHASVPPWSWADPTTAFPSPPDTLRAIGLKLPNWRVVRTDAARREAIGPDGRHASVTDTVIVITKES